MSLAEWCVVMSSGTGGAEMNNQGAKTRSGRAFPAKPPWHPKPATADALRRLGRFAVFSVSAFPDGPTLALSLQPLAFWLIVPFQLLQMARL